MVVVVVKVVEGGRVVVTTPSARLTKLLEVNLNSKFTYQLLLAYWAGLAGIAQAQVTKVATADNDKNFILNVTYQDV